MERKPILAQQLDLTRPVNDLIKLLWAGEYIPSSVVQNKVLYLCCHRYILPSTGVSFSHQIAKLIRAAISFDDLVNDLDLILFELVKRYNTTKKKYKRVKLRGYIFSMIPYLVKALLDKYHKQIDNTYLLDPNEFDLEDTRDYSGLNPTGPEPIELSKLGMIRFMKDVFGLSSKELGEYYSINPVSIRRLLMENNKTIMIHV